MAKKSLKNPMLSALRCASNDEAAAVALLERIRWGDEPSCPLPGCGDRDVYQMQDRKTGERHKHYRWRCRSCGKMFSVRTGTVLAETRLPLRVWVYAFWKACASKKGISALQISRECEITHKSALFLMHRIREAMGSDGGLLGGVVEADETYIGGKPRRPHGMGHSKRKLKPGDKKKSPRWGTGGHWNKEPVLAMVERGGRARVVHMDWVTSKTVKDTLQRQLSPDATLMTDEALYYKEVGKTFPRHESVNHSAGEYVRGDASTNTVEGFFSLLKRGIYGTFHVVSVKHLHRYLKEFEFRHNTRDLDDGARVVAAIRGAEGKRLYYRQPA